MIYISKIPSFFWQNTQQKEKKIIRNHNILHISAYFYDFPKSIRHYQFIVDIVFLLSKKFLNARLRTLFFIPFATKKLQIIKSFLCGNFQIFHILYFFFPYSMQISIVHSVMTVLL
jgi:hypothetical protein